MHGEQLTHERWVGKAGCSRICSGHDRNARISSGAERSSVAIHKCLGLRDGVLRDAEHGAFGISLIREERRTEDCRFLTHHCQDLVIALDSVLNRVDPRPNGIPYAFPAKGVGSRPNPKSPCFGGDRAKFLEGELGLSWLLAACATVCPAGCSYLDHLGAEEDLQSYRTYNCIDSVGLDAPEPIVSASEHYGLASGEYTWTPCDSVLDRVAYRQRDVPVSAKIADGPNPR